MDIQFGLPLTPPPPPNYQHTSILTGFKDRHLETESKLQYKLSHTRSLNTEKYSASLHPISNEAKGRVGYVMQIRSNINTHHEIWICSRGIWLYIS